MRARASCADTMKQVPLPTNLFGAELLHLIDAGNQLSDVALMRLVGGAVGALDLLQLQLHLSHQRTLGCHGLHMHMHAHSNMQEISLEGTRNVSETAVLCRYYCKQGVCRQAARRLSAAAT